MAEISVNEMVAAINAEISAQPPLRLARALHERTLTAARDYILRLAAENAEMRAGYLRQEIASDCLKALDAVGMGKPLADGSFKANTLVCMVEEACALIAEMRKVTGPKCPKCGHWLKAEHGTTPGWVTGPQVASCNRRPCQCCISGAVLQRDHPDIARELGLEVERGE